MRAVKLSVSHPFSFVTDEGVTLRGGCLRRSELLLRLIILKLDERWEEQDHVASLVHDWAAAVAAANLAWQLMSGRLLLAVIPDQVMVAAGKVDVPFVENCGPLETST